MSEDEILASMVKGRECCRQMIQAYELVRTGNGSTAKPLLFDSTFLTSANRAVSQMLMHLKKIPQKMGEAMSSDFNRKYASRLLVETEDMLGKAVMLEREMRSVAGKAN